MTDELKDCPFCGSKVDLVHMGPNYRVDCPKCESSFELHNHEDKEELIYMWNSRTLGGKMLVVDDGEKIWCHNIVPDDQIDEPMISAYKEHGYRCFYIGVKE